MASNRWLVRLAALFCLIAASAAAGGRAAAGAAVAVGAEVSVRENGSTRLTLTLSAPVAATVFLLEKPDRAIIDLPEINFQLEHTPSRSHGGVIAAVRAGLVGPGRSRLVVELAAPATVARMDSAEDPETGATLLRLDLARADRDGFRRAVAADRTDLVLTTGSIGPPAARDTRPLLAIDAGHGGTDPGAIAPGGIQEKDLTLAFAESLRERLPAERYRVLMIRDHDVFVPLDERVRRAREAGADLFLSIHADIISSPHVSGGTLYIGGEMATDSESATLADRENAADAAGGLARTAPPEQIADILHDLTMRETRSFSNRMAGLLLRDLGQVMRFSPRPQREAGFRVLRSPDLPSVLIELGYLSNARDLDLMLSPEWRRRTTAAMASAVERFFAARVAGRAPMSP